MDAGNLNQALLFALSKHFTDGAAYLAPLSFLLIEEKYQLVFSVRLSVKPNCLPKQTHARPLVRLRMVLDLWSVSSCLVEMSSCLVCLSKTLLLEVIKDPLLQS